MARRDRDEVVAAFEAAQAAIAPVYTMTELLADAHAQAREIVTDVDGVRQQGAVARLSATPAELRHPGRPLGADTDDIVARLWER